MTDFVSVVQVLDTDTVTVDNSVLTYLETPNTETSVVVVDADIITLLEMPGDNTVASEEEVITIVAEAIQGPQGIQGLPGVQGAPGGASFQRTAAVALGGHRVVLLNSAGLADYASSMILSQAARVIGLTLNAAESGAPVTIAFHADVTEPSWNWQQDMPVYLGTNGLLTQTPPAFPAAKFSLVVGFPISATTLFVNIGTAITLTN